MQRFLEEPSQSCFSLVRQQWVPQPPETVFAFFAQAANLEQLTPPWLRFQIVSPQPFPMAVGAHIAYRVRWRGVPLRWLTEILEWQPPLRFVDLQLRGPYAYWDHTHQFEPVGNGTRISDVVRYRLPLGIVGAIAHRLSVRRDLQAVFDYREQRVDEQFRSTNLCGHEHATSLEQIAEQVLLSPQNLSPRFSRRRGNSPAGP
jgi:ligand-binding SRPBCC domain-containing protein